MKPMKRKGVLEMSSTAIAVISLILVVALGATVLQNIRTTELDRAILASQLDDRNPITVNTNNGAVNFDFPNRFNGLNPAASGVVASNSTSGTVYASGNYTTTTTSFTWTNAFANGTGVNFTYTVTYDDLGYDTNITTTGLIAVDVFADFFSIIVVVIVFAVIIGMFGMFALRGGVSRI